MENVKLINRVSDRQADDSDSIDPLFMGFNIERKLDHICILNIFLMYNFELMWQDLDISDQAQLICDSQLYPFTGP